MNKHFRLFILISFFVNCYTISAQKTAIYNPETASYQQAILLFSDQQFLSAQLLFEKIAQQNQGLKSDCDYYIANCAIHLQQPNAAQMVEDFVKNNPTSTKKNRAYIEVAQYYFEQNQFQVALQWFEKVDETDLTTLETEKFCFEKAYSFFASKNKKEAINYFNKVTNSREFGTQAKYYLGFMAYENDDYTEATKQFDQVAGESQYQEKMSYFQADMNFKAGKFEQAIALGQKALTKSTVLEKSELSKIIGESYFNLKQYDASIPFLKAYKGKKGKWNNTDYYMLGYAFYKQNDFEKAIAQFNKIIDGKDGVAQNAYYHLGESYLKLDQKQQALNAFKNASEMKFEPKIQEDATLNYAKLSYEIGNSYQSVPDVLTAFLKKYPTNANKVAVETLLIDSYVSSKNYQGALALLEKLNSFENNKILQKVTYFRALELYADGKYQETLTMLGKSIAAPRDQKFLAKATFWKAETEFGLDNFEAALLSFKQFLNIEEAKNTTEFKNCNYNLGYCYFKLKQYDQAALYFEKFVVQTNLDKQRVNDAYLRIGDSYFVSTQYQKSIDAYNNALKMNGIDFDYAYFQKSICFGFIDQNAAKIEGLKQFVSKFAKSQYRDDALFELGNTYIYENKNDEAIAVFDQLLLEFRNGIYASKAVLKQGLIYYNNDKNSLALLKFKKVAAEYGSTPEAVEAVATARLIYVDTGKVDEYAVWVKTLPFIQVTDIELDNDTFEAAEKQYLQNNSKQAIAGFVGYLSTFENGNHALNANYYLAQLYFLDGLENNAQPNYEYVISRSKNEFTEPSLVRLSEIYIKSKNQEKALRILKRLENEADFPQNITFAQANLMKIYYEKQDFVDAVLAAEKVLNNPKTDDKVRSDAQIIVARAALKSNDDVKARLAYAQLLKIAKGELAAEALYYEAYFKNKDNDFEASNGIIQKLTKNYSGYKYFGAKGLVVMAKNFYGQKDAFQANYILESVIKNFSEFKDVIVDAKEIQAQIMTEEAKTNSSIQN